MDELDEKRPLRRGWTTGACATAATKAAFTALLTGEFPDPVEITLPGGQAVAFALAVNRKDDGAATAGVIKDAGAASNVDIGNVGAMNQQELHDCIKGWFPYSSGNMHIKSSPFWDIGQAVKFTESLGYKGLYSIEVSRHEAVRIVYNTILANLA